MHLEPSGVCHHCSFCWIKVLLWCALTWNNDHMILHKKLVCLVPVIKE